MRKKFFLLFLVCLFTVFTASQSCAEIAYKLVTASDLDEEITADLLSDLEYIVGGNFYGTYEIPKLAVVSFDNSAEEPAFYPITVSFDLSWTLSSDKLTDVIIQSVKSDDEGKYLIELSGVLPSEIPEDGYPLSFSGKITSADEEYQDVLIDLACNIEVEAIEAEEFGDGEEYTAVTEDSMADYITDFGEKDLKNVSSAYSVTVNSIQAGGTYVNYIDSPDYGNASIELPVWLAYDNVTNDSTSELDNPITSLTIKVNNEYYEKFKNGTKGLVRIPFVNAEGDPVTVLSWEVMLSKPFEISTSPKTVAFDLTAGGDPVVKEIEYTGSDPVKYTQGTTITGVNFKVNSADSKITVTAEATSAATAGEKTTTLTFNDANNNSDELSVTVKVTVPTTPKITISGTKTLTVTAGGESVSTTLTAGGSISGALSWEIVSVPDGLNVELTKSSDKTADFSISAESSATAGQKTVSIKVTDSVSALNETANLVITVEEAPKEEQEDITSSITLKDSSGKSVSKPFSGLKPGEKGSFTITLPSEIVAKIWTLLINNVAVKTVTVSGTATMAADNDWLTISNYSSTGATIDADVPSNLSGNAAISFSVTDTNDKEYTADLGTISKTSTSTGSSGSGCNVSFGALSLAVAALLFVRKNAKN